MKILTNLLVLPATIHQPSSELFQVFDRLLLLKKGGETVYFGELGENSSTLIDYFGARTDLKCGPQDNPAEYILEAIGAGASSTASTLPKLGSEEKYTDDDLFIAQDWHGLWKESDEFHVAQRQIEEFHSTYQAKVSAADTAADSGRRYAAHTTTQIYLVTQRAFQNYWRDSNYIIAKIMLNIAAGLFVGFSFWASPDNIAGLQTKLFAVFSE